MSKPAAHPEPPVPPPAAESSGQADAAADALAAFHPATQTWFREAFAEPTGAQCRAWPPIAAGKSTLLLAPTGSGKTLAAFLASLDRVMFDRSAGAKAPGEQAADTPEERVRVLYISPLKALGVDIDRNLRAPIAGIRAVANRTGQAVHEPTVAIRSGDTTSRDRQAINRHPPDVLITTPESLYLMLTSNAEAVLQGVETVIIDEIHVMAPTKRGAHLFLSLERLERRRRQANPEAPPLQRIGLSATQRPLDEIARLLGGADGTADPDEPVAPRPVEIVDASAPKKLDLLVEVPVEDMARLGEGAFGRGADPVGGGPMRGGFDGGEPDVDVLGGDGLDDSAGGSIDGNAAMGSPFSSPTPPSIWPSIHPRLVELIRAHRSTMIFVNSRRLAERLATAINELAAEDDPEAGEIALAHHGSVAKDKRAAIEDRLKRGQLPAIVATSSLELGIDMGAVDLVIQIEAPPSIASGMQRIGRAGHRVGATSRGVVFPKYRGDLLACSAATGRMLAGRVEETFYPRNPLDLLAQQIVAVTARESIDVDELYALVRGAASFADLPRSSFEGVLDLLAGRYPSDEFAELRPRINWDRLAGVISARRGAQRLAVLNGGTIPDRGLYGVFLAGEGPDGAGGSRVGELDEEMVFETQPGDVFLLGASSWRVLDITRDRVIVAPAPGEPGRMPFWRGDAPGRPLEFGRAIGKLSRELLAEEQGAARTRLREDHALDEKAADNLLRYLAEQQEATGEAPSDRAIVAEAFLDEIGDWRICLLSPFGARVHAPWAIAVAGRLREEGYGEVDLNWGDDGLIFRLPESDTPPDVDRFIPRADEVEELISRQLGSTALFAARFRENAARALLLPKRRPQGRTPLWMQRRRSADLLQVAARYPSFPMLLETYRECLQDVFDLPGLVGLLRDIERRAVQVVRAETSAPSPFAASLLFNYTTNFLYEGDAPLAER
ncbi:MAG: DEAD/DEAH box helicase, partial [Planctomycetota bacterium]